MKLDKLPESIDPTLDLDQIRSECYDMITRPALLSAGISTIPVPMVDLVIDAGLLSHLLPQISARFKLTDLDSIQQQQSASLFRRGIDFAKLAATRGVLRKSLNGLGKRLVLEQFAKFIPLGGQMVAATISYQVMKKIAGDHIEECYQQAKALQAKARGRGTVVNG